MYIFPLCACDQRYFVWAKTGTRIEELLTAFPITPLILSGNFNAGIDLTTRGNELLQLFPVVLFCHCDQTNIKRKDFKCKSIRICYSPPGGIYKQFNFRPPIPGIKKPKLINPDKIQTLDLTIRQDAFEKNAHTAVRPTTCKALLV